MLMVAYCFSCPMWGGEVRNADSAELSDCKEINLFTMGKPSEELGGAQANRLAANAAVDKYRIKYQDGDLTVTWYDERYSCDAEIKYVTMEMVGDNQLLFNFEVADNWRSTCRCYQDVSGTFKGISPGEYIISFGDKNLGYTVMLEEDVLMNLKPKDLTAVEGSGVAENSEMSDCKGNPWEYYGRSEDPILKREQGKVNTDDPFNPSNGTVYSLTYSDGKLVVGWYNLEENCAAAFKYTVLERLDGNVLYFKYELVDDYALADCDCLFDIKATHSDIEPGEYTLRFKNDANEYNVRLEESKPLILYSREPTLTSINELYAEEKNVLHLNNDNVEINCEGEYLLEIYDFSGALLISQKGRGNSTVQLDGLDHGAYLLKVTEGNRKESLRILR